MSANWRNIHAITYRQCEAVYTPTQTSRIW